MNENNVEKQQKEKKKWQFKDHWKSIVTWSCLVLLIIIGYLIVAGAGAPEFSKNGAGSTSIPYPYVKGNFTDCANALSWYFNVVLIDNFLGVPAILLAVLSFIGYIVLKRGFVDSLVGAIKTAIGVLLLSIGSTALQGVVKPILTGIQNSLSGSGDNHLSVIALDPYIGWSSGYGFLDSFCNNTYATWVSYALLVGFVFNLVLVGMKKWTNCQAVMTTGHIMFQQSAVVVPFVYILFFRTFPLLGDGDVSASSTAGTIIFSGIFLGTYWSVGTTSTIKPTNIITENANFAIGHQQTIGISLAYRLGKYFKFTKKGQEVVSAEKRKMSRKFRIFEDNVFVQSLLIVILFLILAIILQTCGTQGNRFTDITAANSTWWSPGNIGSFWVVQVLMGAFLTVASLLTIITGVRMFVTELQQSFQGISEKVIPGSVVAVDIAAVYGFSPNAVTYGFLSGIVGQFIGVGISIGLSQIPGSNNVIVVPLFITLFFNSGAVGVYANVKGGWKAAIAIPFIAGLIEIIVISFALGQVNDAVSQAVTLHSVLPTVASPVLTGYNGMIDWNLFFGFPLIFAAMDPIAAYIILPLEIVAMLIVIQFVDTALPHANVSPLKKLFLSKKQLNKVEQAE